MPTPTVRRTAQSTTGGNGGLARLRNEKPATDKRTAQSGFGSAKKPSHYITSTKLRFISNKTMSGEEQHGTQRVFAAKQRNTNWLLHNSCPPRRTKCQPMV